jgi:hypothetical protein
LINQSQEAFKIILRRRGDKNKENGHLPEGLPSLSQTQIFLKNKFHRSLVFYKKMTNMMSARTFSLCTGKNGDGKTVSQPHPEEGRVILWTGLHSHLLWP